MSILDYKRVMTAVFATVAASLILSVGSVVANHFNTKFQVQDHDRRISEIEKNEEKVATHDYVMGVYQSAKDVAEIKEENIIRRVEALEKKQDAIYDILIEINKKLD